MQKYTLQMIINQSWQSKMALEAFCLGEPKEPVAKRFFSFCRTYSSWDMNHNVRCCAIPPLSGLCAWKSWGHTVPFLQIWCFYDLWSLLLILFLWRIRIIIKRRKILTKTIGFQYICCLDPKYKRSQAFFFALET